MADYATNSTASHSYEILETFEAGLVLRGHEVRSIKTGKASIKGSYVRIINGQPYLVGARITPYQSGNMPAEYREQADRKLLMGKPQIANIVGLIHSHGVSLVPLKLYDKNGLIKLLVGVARGKKKYDKRESIKKKDLQRSKERGSYDA
jgi:SsrA-binding protein